MFQCRMPVLRLLLCCSLHAKISNILIIQHTTIPHLQHIKIFPSAGLTLLERRSGFIEDICDGAVEG